MEKEDDKKKVVKIAIPQAKEEDSDSDDCYEIDPIDFTRVLVVSSFDDDCYEIDPIDFTRKLVISSSDDDGIAIVSEKGHVALRDFPHPRHLCGNFPFSRTAHETYCSKCFCYVCEVAAPCSDWWGQKGHCNVCRKESDSRPPVLL